MPLTRIPIVMRSLMALLPFGRRRASRDASVFQLRGAKIVLLAQGLMEDIDEISARVAGPEGERLMAVLTSGPSPTRLERLLTVRNIARSVLDQAKAAELDAPGGIDFDIAAEQFCQARADVELLLNLREAAHDLPVAA